ncbi:MAG: hypothetical protein II832_03845 [Synergistaceae bacterium]|nr:hypothetical protein [Synergistaceae bacterium]
MKAKTIDRLQLTRDKFRHLNIDTSDLPQEPNIHGNMCPNCGQNTLIHESGCVKCPSCGWSACG